MCVRVGGWVGEEVSGCEEEGEGWVNEWVWVSELDYFEFGGECGCECGSE